MNVLTCIGVVRVLFTATFYTYITPRPIRAMVYIMTSTFLLCGVEGISNNFSGVDLFVVSTYFFTFRFFLTVFTNYPVSLISSIVSPSTLLTSTATFTQMLPSQLCLCGLKPQRRFTVASVALQKADHYY